MNSPTTASETPYAAESVRRPRRCSRGSNPHWPRARTHRSPRASARARPYTALRRVRYVARLRAVAAKLHRAPGRRPVRRSVVERPAAVAARLEPTPRAVEHRGEGDRDEPVERVAAVVEPRAPTVVEAKRESRGRRVQRLDSRRIERHPVVGERERAERLAQGTRPFRLGDRAVLGEPVVEPVELVLPVDAVHELLHRTQGLGRGSREVVARLIVACAV